MTNRHHRSVAFLINSPVTIVATLIGLFASARQALEEFTHHTLFLYAILIIIVSIALYWLDQAQKYFRLKLLPEGKNFHPFNPPEHALLPRDEEVRRLRQHLDGVGPEHSAPSNRVTVVIGRSGVGKSKLTTVLLRDALKKDHKHLLAVQGDGNVVDELIGKLQKLKRDFVGSSVGTKGRDAENAADEKAVEELLHWKHGQSPSGPISIRRSTGLDKITQSFCARFIPDKDIVIVFDQIERYMDAVLESPTNGVRFFALVREMQKTKTVRIIFVARSDYLFQLMENLETAMPAASGTILDNVSLFVVEGIVAKANPAAETELQSRLRNVAADDEFFEKFKECVHLDDATKSNTFLMQLVGYLAEVFYGKDETLTKLIDQRNDDRNAYLNFYVRHLLQQFARERGDVEAVGALGAVLYAVAAATKRSGAAIPSPRIAGLSHFPQEVVTKCCDYLADRHVFLKVPGREPSYRIVHDILSDYFENSPLLGVRAELKDSIPFLSEPARIKAELTAPTMPWPVYYVRKNFYLPGRKVPNLSYIFLVALTAFGATRILAPHDMFRLMQPVDNYLNSLLPGMVETFGFNVFYYVPIYATLITWAFFVYQLDRGFVQQVVRNRALSLFSNLVLPVGGSVGALTAFAPSLYMLPIGVCGLGVAATLVFLSMTGGLRESAAKEVRRWGARTAGNIALILFATPYLYSLIRLHQVGQGHSAAQAASYDVWGGDWTVFATIVLLSIGLFWMWVHIRREQGTLEGWSAKIGQFDQGLVA